MKRLNKDRMGIVIRNKFSKFNKKQRISTEKSNFILDSKGITLLALVITVIILLILAGITLSLTIGQNGIITKASEAGRIQKLADIKEKIGLEILDAQTEAIMKGEQLGEDKIKDIVSDYGTLRRRWRYHKN